MQRVMLSLGWVMFPLSLFAMAIGISAMIAEGGPDLVGHLFALIAMCMLGVGVYVVLCWNSLRLRSQRGTPERHYRLATFARENGMAYLPGPIPGTHLTPWRARGELILTRVIRPVSPRPLELANYMLMHPALNNRNAGVGGICSITLPTHLPHILLVAKKDGRTLPGATPADAQVLSLEGDFDDHFTLHCPEGYEQDALYLFTPDVMAALIDHVNGFDVEIIDDWLFLVSSRDVVTLDPETWHDVVAATAAVTAQIDRWASWRDSRLAAAPVPPSSAREATTLPAARRVASGGRRLKMAIGSGGILTAIIATAYVAALLIAGAVL